MNISPPVVNEITIVGSRCGPFIPALDLIKKNLIEIGPLVTARYSLDQAIQAFKQAAQPGA